jgi:hypothetical protein
MAQLNFYATTEDVVAVIDFMFSLGTLELYEAYSRKDAEIRKFSSAAEIVGSGHIEENHGGVFVRGAWASVTRGLKVRRFSLNPSVGSFRHEVVGVGVFQLIQGRPHDLAQESLDRSIFSHWNEAGARQRSAFDRVELDEVNWAELRRLSGKVHRQVRDSLSVARVPTGHVMPGAYRWVQEGGKLFGYPTLISVGSPMMTTIGKQK